MCNFWNCRQWPGFMPKYGNFENQPVSWKWLCVEQKYSQFRPLWVEWVYTCNFWNYAHLPSFMPKYGNFEKWPVSRTSASMAKISSISTSWGRKTVCVQLLELWPLGKFHAQLWHYWKLARISETTDRRAKTSSISTSWGRKRVYAELWPILNAGKMMLFWIP